MTEAPGPTREPAPDESAPAQPDDGARTARRRRRRVAGATGVAAAGLVAAGLVAALLTGGWPPAPAPGSPAEAADAQDAAPARSQPVAGSIPLGVAGEPVAPPAAPPADGGEDVLPPVAVGEDVALQSGLVATVTAVEDVTITPRGPGDVVGPGEGVTLTLRNDSGAPVDLATLAVVATAPDGAPAIPSDDPATEPLTGTLAPGQEVSGVYVFRVPDPGAALSVEIGVNTSSDVAVVDAP